ncbi:hypothetical protein SASPL_130192 [Salvia splendens]|uniref:Beta-amyrin synthase n=1 Tax=Salvia splendens TaxID=180675 RepID=A0A8X8X7N9_SALSN|nr:hypothetical protein SASPL_130192 [Salvia splendens]
MEREQKGFHSCGDLFLRLQQKRESGIDLLGIPPVRIGENEEISYEAATTAVKKALRVNRAVQASNGHWPAENAGPLFFTPPLLISLYISWTLNKVMTSTHINESIRYIDNHRVNLGLILF